MNISGTNNREGWICPVCRAGVSPNKDICEHPNHNKQIDYRNYYGVISPSFDFKTTAVD